MIQVENLTKEFITSKKYQGLGGAIKGLFTNEKICKTAVDNISFNIKAGEIVGYLGNNGAGKSTTIKMMTGIITPTSGKCIVNGIEPYKQRKENALNIGVVFGQRTQLWWDLPLNESFSILKELYGIPKTKYVEQMVYLNEVLDLNSFINNTVRTLSLGQRMRADLAASLLHNPKVLYLDEPTIGLDVLVKEKMRKAIIDINRNYNTTVVLTTHDLEDIEQLCSRIIIINEGKKIYDGTVQKIKEMYNPKTCLKICVQDTKNIRDINFCKEFNVCADELYVSLQEKEILFEFQNGKISISDIVICVAKCVEIKSISIDEKEITDIIKKIYTNGIEKNIS